MYRFLKCDCKNKCELPKTYWTKPCVKFGKICGFPELAVLHLYKEKGYRGFWADTFHKKYWQDMQSKFSFDDLDINNKKIVDKIKKINDGNIKGFWDLIIWKDKKIKFVEVKGMPSKDKLRDTQIKFKDNMLAYGFDNDDFIVMEWDYS